jgi:hypothetical protein
MKTASKVPPHKIDAAKWDHFTFSKDQIIDSMSHFDDMINRNWSLQAPTAHLLAARKRLAKLPQ